MQQLKQELEIEVKRTLENKNYNTKQKEDLFRYFKESFMKNSNKEKSLAVADIRFNHKYMFNKQHDRYTLKQNYIKRKIDKVKI